MERRVRGASIVTRHRVEVARAFMARRNPPAVRQRLQVTADGGLGELQDAAQLRDRQLVPIQEEQNAAPRRVGQCVQVIEYGWGAAAHLIRPSGLNDKCRAAVKGSGSGVLGAVHVVLPDKRDDLRARNEVVDALLEEPDPDYEPLQPPMQGCSAIATPMLTCV